jgi:hypothetical protein
MTDEQWDKWRWGFSITDEQWDNIHELLVLGGYEPPQRIEEEAIRAYRCPRGHNFSTANPLIIAVENEPEYNTGPICTYCLVDWHKRNVNAEQVTNE